MQASSLSSDEELSGKVEPTAERNDQTDTASTQTRESDDSTIEALSERVEQLESELSAYEKKTDKKLNSVEKLAKKPHVSPEERFYRIQEES